MATKESTPRGLSVFNPDSSNSILELCKSLLARESVATSHTVRILHHFACTGGTLISKVVASMPNVYLLSEAHPNSPTVPVSGVYAPSDLTLLARAALIPFADEAAEELFVIGLEHLNCWAERYGGTLVVRDHSHSDFCVNDDFQARSTVRKLCEERFQRTLSVVTVRDPRDSFMSLINSGFQTFQPLNFKNYCRRYLAFLDALPDSALFKYEDIVSEPERQFSLICEALELGFDDVALETFSAQILSGDSGRTSSIINRRARRPGADDLDCSRGDPAELMRLLGYDV